MENNKISNNNNEIKKLSNLNGSCNLSIDQCDMTSLEILNKCHLDLFPKKKTICDDVDCMRIVDQLPILNGEYIQFIGPSGKQNEEILLVTNFRLFLLMQESTSFINVPLMLIESIEIKEIVYIYIYLKNVKTIRLTFSSNEKTTIWSQRLNSILIKPYKLEELFAFTFYSWLTNEKSDETKCLFSKNDSSMNLVYKEFKRLKFDTKLWRISEANKKFELCPTYPETLIVPKCMTDEQIKKIANFRSSKRFPAVVWRSKTNGAVLARSSQPNVGLLAWRLNEDELLIKAIADSSTLSNSSNKKLDTKNSNATINNLSSLNTPLTSNNSSNDLKSSNATQTSITVNSNGSQTDQSSVLLIIDARFRSVALANRVKGGGYEYSEYYTNCEIQFMNLENIHVIRNSFQSLRLLCQTINDNKLFYSQLENTKWLHHLSGILKAACTVITAIDRQAKPVLIHCSDGWDRTPQILALAKLLLDPYYRTISGFRSLVELEWLMFGHKFSQRNGHSASNNDINERCPVFLQWLDCVYQIQRQFPWAFEFNETFLLKLCFHSYSCLFGTFLCDSAVERVNEHIDERTFSVWSYLNDKNKEMINYLYDDSFDEVLYPMCELVNMQLWQKLFCESEIAFLVQTANKHEMQPNFNDSISESLGTAGSLVIAASLTNINGSNQQIDDDLEMEASIVTDSKLQVDSSSSSSSKSSNNLIKKSILEKRLILNKTPNCNINSNQNNILHKTRSYEEMSKSFIIKQLADTKDASNTSTNFKLNDDLNEIHNGDPIHVRSCSESNLLLDALQNISSTSPKFIENKNNYLNLVNHNNNNNNSNNEDTVSKKEENLDLALNETNTTTSNTDTTKLNNLETNLKEINLNEPSDLLVSNTDSIESAQSLTSTLTPATTITAPIINASTSSATSSILMQKSTDTLVDESSLVNKKHLNGNSNSNKMQTNEDTAYEEDDLFDLKNSTNINKLPCFRHGSNGSLILLAQKPSTESSSTPLSSSIPSPASLTIHHNFNNGKKSNGLYSNGLNNVSTSTSGLSEYVTSTRLKIFNDTIKYFEKSFNEDNTSNTNSNETNANKLNLNNNGVSSSDEKTIENLNGKRQTSNSIPIRIKNSDENKKRNKNKNIQDCIDIDGLTKIYDPTCRKVVERDEQYQKEIATLKEQVNKCKTFLNSLSNNNLWQDGSNSFIKNELLLEKSQTEENQSNSYSFSNDSVCSSSWDEIDESDYRLATWVPDYCISHCQNCNSKFSYRLRKHHCRNCGQVFCYKCADQFYPLPNHNLTAPVRVCYNCKLQIERQHQQQASASSTTSSIVSNPVNINSETTYSNLKPNQEFKFSYSPSSMSYFSNQPLQHQQQHSFSKPIQNTASSSCNIGIRCNQLDTNKFKKNGTKSQKVSV